MPRSLDEIRRERSLVLIKPDAVARHIVGEILQRFERKGLKIVAMKMVWPSVELAGRHYTDDEAWIKDTGERTYNSYVEKGLEPPAGPREIALDVRRKLMETITVGPVIALVLEGAHVIETVRKMRGATSPQLADVGTVGFDYTTDSYELADAGDWAIRNIIHGSDSPQNAEREIKIWFKSDELIDYETQITKLFYRKDWHQN